MNHRFQRCIFFCCPHQLSRSTRCHRADTLHNTDSSQPLSPTFHTSHAQLFRITAAGTRERPTPASELAVPGAARAWLSDRNPRTVPPAIRHRDQLPPNATGVNLHWHMKSSAAAVSSGRRLDSAKSLGMDSLHAPRRWVRRQHDIGPGTPAVQAHARMDRPRNRCRVSRRLNTSRHSTAVNQPWNYRDTIGDRQSHGQLGRLEE